MGYVATGPWASGGAPGINAPFLNTLEAFLSTINSGATDSAVGSSGGLFSAASFGPAPSPNTVVGSLGSASLFQFFQGGSVLGFIVTWTGYNNSATQNLTVPSPFGRTGMFQIYETQSGTVTFLNSGSSVTCSVQNTMNSAVGGTQNAVTNVHGWSAGQTRGGFDTLQLLFNGGSPATGSMWCIGA